MSKQLFLGRLKNNDDCNCIYTEHVRFECGHYFSSIHNGGASWSGGHAIKNTAYEDITTGLTPEQWARAQEIDKALDALGYCITEGDDRYKVGEALANEWNNMIDSIQGCQTELEIMADERERIKDKYNLDDDDLEIIFDTTQYHDIGCISGIYDSVENFGEEEAWSLGIFNEHDSNFASVLMDCFDFEKFGYKCMENDYAVELNDGRVVSFYY